MNIKARVERLEAATAELQRRIATKPKADAKLSRWLKAMLELSVDARLERLDQVADLTPAQIEHLRYVWEFFARAEQVEPSGPWSYWLVMAGRGFGKTRTGAEMVRKWARKFHYVNLVGATSDDARDIMIEGESGILACCPEHERPEYRKSERKLLWPNGGVSLVFTADEPERLRGKQHEKLWCDELAAWRYGQEAWDQALLGLRIGSNPQAVITTTPRPTDVVKAIMAHPACVVTRGPTYANRRNLAPSFYSSIITKFEGTRLGRQELNAELLEDNPAALWQRSDIDRYRVKEASSLQRIVAGVDPAVSSSEGSAETGIVFAARGPAIPNTPPGPHFYVIADLSIVASPEKWARQVVDGYRANHADRIIGEANNGGDMIEALIRTVDANVPYTKVTATRGKAIRAEPIAALYEQGRVHHVGAFPELEDQMCDFDPSSPPSKSPDRMDALVWALTALSNTDGHAILDYYRDQAEKRAQSAVSVYGPVRLHVPQGFGGVSTERGMIRPDADGCITVPPNLARSLIAAGYTRVDAVQVAQA